MSAYHDELRARAIPPETSTSDMFMTCMATGVAHEQRAHSTGPQATHLRLAVEQFAAALAHKPDSGWAELRLATVLLHLSHHDPPASATAELREALALLRSGNGTPACVAKEVLGSVCIRLSAMLREYPDAAIGHAANDSEPLHLAVEALDALEDLVADQMDRASSLGKDDFAAEAPALAQTFLSLADAASVVSALATDLETAESHAVLADSALEHAGNMANLDATSNRPAPPAAWGIGALGVMPDNVVGPDLITHVQYVSARIALQRLDNPFLTAPADLHDDWAHVLGEMGGLATRARERANRLRGNRGAIASAQACEAVALLADARAAYAAVLHSRHKGYSRRNSNASLRSLDDGDAWTPMTPLTPLSEVTPALARSAGSWSSANGSIESPPIPEEREDELEATPPLVSLPDAPKDERKTRAPPPPPLTLVPRAVRLPSSPLNPARQSRPNMSPRRASFHFPPSTPLSPVIRRSSWTLSAPPTLENGEALGFAQAVENRAVLTRAASAAAAADLHAQWHHLAAAGKDYKVALALLAAARVPQPLASRRKAELLLAIASVALSRADLAPFIQPQSEALSHVPPPTPRADPRSGARTTGLQALLSTAEVYSTWAAREVGWSSVIVPTEHGERTSCIVSDEIGVRGVLTTLRVWWVRWRNDMAMSPTNGSRSDSAASATSPSDGDPAVNALGMSNLSLSDTVLFPEAAEVVARLKTHGVYPAAVSRFLRRLDVDPEEECFWVAVARRLGSSDSE